jgi:hypothetical protein
MRQQIGRSLSNHFRQNPQANYGVRTGGKSNIFVLDIDGPVGKRNLSELVKKNGKRPKTVIVEIANGEHRYFKGDGRAIGNSAGKLGKGLDISGRQVHFRDLFLDSPKAAQLRFLRDVVLHEVGGPEAVSLLPSGEGSGR